MTASIDEAEVPAVARFACSVDRLAKKLTDSTLNLVQYLSSYRLAKGSDDEQEMEKAADGARMTWSGIDASRDELGAAWSRATDAIKNAKQRVPKSLINDGDAKKALQQMGSITVEKQREITRVTKEIGSVEGIIRKHELI